MLKEGTVLDFLTSAEFCVCFVATCTEEFGRFPTVASSSHKLDRVDTSTLILKYVTPMDVERG